MKKMIVPVVIGLVVGLGGSMAAQRILEKDPATLEQSLDAAIGDAAIDSAGVSTDSVAVAHGDSIAEPLASSPAVAETTHVTGHPAAAQALAANAPGTSVESDTTPTAERTGLPDGALTSAELAKLFAAMQARDAAKVLEQMEDFEVQVILGALGNREAAAILSNLSPERAAVISRAVIRGERSVP